MMHSLHRGQTHPGASSILYLPMTDMYPGDKSYILSTLDFLCNMVMRHHVSLVITFDQPLYWNAALKNSHLKGIVLRLGTFHMFMNLLGAIDTLMAGTGLKNILELVYGENAVVHMMWGKLVKRAFRGHLLVSKCLHQIILASVVDENSEFMLHVEEIEKMYSSLLTGDISLENFEESAAIGNHG